VEIKKTLHFVVYLINGFECGDTEEQITFGLLTDSILHHTMRSKLFPLTI